MHNSTSEKKYNVKIIGLLLVGLVIIVIFAIAMKDFGFSSQNMDIDELNEDSFAIFTNADGI